MLLERLYRALLLLYPRDHRQEYREPMIQLYRDRMRRDGGGIRTYLVWGQLILDLVCSASREHREGFILKDSPVKRIGVQSGKFLLQSLIWTFGLYGVTAIAFMTVGLAALSMGWFPFFIESGPFHFLGYTMIIENGVNWSLTFEFSPPAFVIFVAAAGALLGAKSVIRTWITSSKS